MKPEFEPIAAGELDAVCGGFDAYHAWNQGISWAGRGALAGAATGAAVGTAIPCVTPFGGAVAGTALGAGAGFLAGAAHGAWQTRGRGTSWTPNS